MIQFHRCCAGITRDRPTPCKVATLSSSCQTGDDDMDQFDKMLAKWQPTALSLFRFITGLLLLQYGIAKLFKFPAVPYFAKVELMSLIGAAGTLELVLGGLLMIGLFSRIVAFILSGEMAFAYFIGHFPKGFFPLHHIAAPDTAAITPPPSNPAARPPRISNCAAPATS